VVVGLSDPDHRRNTPGAALRHRTSCATRAC
jgi:hypothetical protein